MTAVAIMKYIEQVQRDEDLPHEVRARTLEALFSVLDRLAD